VPKYDLAVVGAGLGGLAAAALVSSQSKKTIVLEPGASAGGVLDGHSRDSFLFYPGPHLSFGFDRNGTIHKLGESLGIALNVSLYSPCYQVALPDRRITVYAEQNETLEELRREFAREIDGIAKFYRDLRAESIKSAKSRLSSFFMSRKSAGRFMRRHHLSREFIAFLDVQSLYFFRRHAADISLLSLITLCDTAPFAVHSGFKKIAEQLVDVILKNKGEIRHGIPFSEVSLGKGRDGGLSTSQGLMAANAVLLNTEQQRRGATLFLGIRDDVIPSGMLHNVLCLADYSRVEDTFTLSLNTKDDGTTAPNGMSTLTASFPLPSAHLTKGELMQKVCEVIPFLSDFVVPGKDFQSLPRAFSMPSDMLFKPFRKANTHAILSRSTVGNAYMLEDGSGTPAQEIEAAQVLVERLR